MSEIMDGIAKVAAEHLDYQGEIGPDTQLVEGMQLDSIRMLTLVVELENHFDICLEEGDEDGIETVGQLASLLESRLG